MNYQEEYYKLIENYPFCELPSEDIINIDERVALAIIKNYQSKEMYSDCFDSDRGYYNRYEDIRFDLILLKYKKDRLFWEKAGIKDYLLNEHFREQFVEISLEFLHDKVFLLDFFNEKKDEFLLDYLKNLVSEQDFEQLEKSYICHATTSDRLEKYEDDEDFIAKIVKINPSIYKGLSKFNQEKESVINSYLNFDYSILSFSKEKQHKLLPKWLKLHNDWDMRIVDQLDYDNIKPIMKNFNDTNDSMLIKKLLSKNVNKYKEVIADFFQKNKNFSVFSHMIGSKPIVELWPVLDHIDCNFYLKTWLDNYSYKKPEKFDTKMLQILQTYPELSKEWEQSLDYQLMNKIINNKNINFDLFKQAFELQFEKLNNNKITYENLEQNMLWLKTYLPLKVLKEIKLPNKNIVKHLQYLIMNEKIVEKGVQSTKFKI